jgi:hypothetical protein
MNLTSKSQIINSDWKVQLLVTKQLERVTKDQIQNTPKC